MFRQVAQNSSIQLVGRFASSFLSFLVTFFLARWLGASLYGEYAKITSYFMVWYLFVDFGLNAFFIRDTKADTSALRREFPAFLGLRLWGSLIISLIALSLGFILSRFGSGFGGYVFGGLVIGFSTIVAFSLQTSALAIFQARLRYGHAQIAQLLGPLTSVLIFIAAARVIAGPPLLFWAVLALVVGSWVSTLFSLYLVRDVLHHFPYLDIPKAQVLLREALPFGIVLLLNTIYFRIDMLILGSMRPSSEVGAYALGYKFFEFALALPTFVMNSLYPLLVAQSKSAQKKSLLKYGGLLLGGSFLVTLVIWIMAPLLTLIKIEYAPSILYLRLLSLSLPLFFISSPLMWWHVLRGSQKKLLPAYFLGVVVNILLNILLIPRYGAVASSIVTGVTELVVIVSLTIVASLTSQKE